MRPVDNVRRRRVLELALQGYTQHEIAAEVGCIRQAVQTLLYRSIAPYLADYPTPADLRRAKRSGEIWQRALDAIEAANGARCSA